MEKTNVVKREVRIPSEWQGKIWWPDADRFSFPEEI